MINLKGSFETARFEAELIPHRSLSLKGSLLASGLTTVLLASVAGFAMAVSQNRAWPVLAAAFLIQGGIQYAFYRNARDARERQILTMDETGLRITHSRPDWNGPIITHMLVPQHARIEEYDIRGITKLMLRYHAQRVPLGPFLPPCETQNLRQGMSHALRSWSPSPPA